MFWVQDGNVTVFHSRRCHVADCSIVEHQPQLQSVINTLLRSFDSCTDWRLHSGLHSNRQSTCTSVQVYMGLYQHSLLTSFVRWQMSRLLSDSVSVPPQQWLSETPDLLSLVTKLSRSPQLVSGFWNILTDPVTSAPSVAVCPSRLKTHLFNIFSYPTPRDCTPVRRLAWPLGLRGHESVYMSQSVQSIFVSRNMSVIAEIEQLYTTSYSTSVETIGLS